ncbi:MAG TPA: MoxR family ATPase [Thermotogota bacterium]|mgnify:CR=1 FL=1|nr:MoxR family ATPase [Thermotogota bacterium]HRW92088.1 MoxR family ATPase [Thermotogota bacterium]
MENLELQQKVEEAFPTFSSIFEELHRVIIGQEEMLQGLLIALLCKGHLLIEGVPGLAKTLAIHTFSRILDVGFKRIQFTPDLLPGDITGTLIFNMKDEVFVVEKGPIFANFVLADEINRAPAKVQSALLEAMQEKQVTIGKNTFALPRPFLVMATQNPIEQEGTYPLPEAQTDRFMMKLEITYPSLKEEYQILRLMGKDPDISLEKLLNPQKILELQQLVKEVYVDEQLQKYIVDIVYATRFPQNYKMSELKAFIRFGASPRATLSLLKTARARALIQGRSYVTADDIKIMSIPVLRHRILLSFEAEADEMQTEDVISKILKGLPVP